MLTMKHIMRPKAGESVEFARLIGSYVVKTKDDYMQFLAYPDEDEAAEPAVWGGFENDKGISNPVVGLIYIMNEQGATVADFRYVMDGDTLVELFPDSPEAPAMAA